MREQGATLHELVRDVVVAPQILVNVRTPHKNVLEVETVREAIASAESELAGSGRLLIRPSGTEPLIRVMAEGDDREAIERIAGDLARRIEQAAAFL
jgi:phosphoglucosamine mutase